MQGWLGFYWWWLRWRDAVAASRKARMHSGNTQPTAAQMDSQKWWQQPPQQSAQQSSRVRLRWCHSFLFHPFPHVFFNFSVWHIHILISRTSPLSWVSTGARHTATGLEAQSWEQQPRQQVAPMAPILNSDSSEGTWRNQGKAAEKA